jgi:hypothetical protein
MRLWADSEAFEIPLAENDPPCGTAACIAGYAVILTKAKPKSWKAGPWKKAVDYVVEEFGDEWIGNVAEEVLDLSRDQADRLFDPNRWPVKFYRSYCDASTPEGMAQAAIRRIEHFIKTEGIE